MISIDKTSETPLYRQLFNACRKEIIDGCLPAGSRLPAIRKLAEDLEIARNTVETAYQQLAQEGYVTSKPGSGYIVEALDLEEMQLARQQRRDEHEAIRGRKADAVPQSDENIAYDFTYGDLQDGSFPSEDWRRLTSEVLFGSEAVSANRYNDTLGDPALREEIARQLAGTRGVHCLPEQVVIQAGTQAALANLLRLFDPSRDVVAMENPGYDGARIVFERSGFETIPLQVDAASGWSMESLESSNATLAFVTPSSQFPTGKIMPLSIRQSLLAWAFERNAYIIEDDYCREFRYNSQPLPALQSFDSRGRVIYMGTLSKALSPALRLNYFVLPRDVLEKWSEAFDGFRSTVPWLSQAVLRLFIQQGRWDRMLRRAQTRNKRKHTALLEAIRVHMKGRVEVMEGGAGLHVLVRALDGRTQDELVESAASAGVRVYATNQYWMGECPERYRYVLIGFSRIREEDIEPGIATLADAWFRSDD